MLKVETFCDSPMNANTYLVESHNSVIVIDPANHMKTLEKFIGDKQIVAVFLTHGHYDHFQTLHELLKKYQIKCYLHPNAIRKLSDPISSCATFFGIKELPQINSQYFIKITDGQVIHFKDMSIKILYTPGHTNCSVVYIMDYLMFTGDTLFQSSVGRTDLPTGSRMALDASLKRLKTLKENYEIYPGHDKKTTFWEELKQNPYLK